MLFKADIRNNLDAVTFLFVCSVFNKSLIVIQSTTQKSTLPSFFNVLNDQKAVSFVVKPRCLSMSSAQCACVFV